MTTITVREFEEKVLTREEVVLVIRAPTSQQVKDYEYERKASGNSSITDWIEQRVRPCIGNLEFTIINGAYTHPHVTSGCKLIQSSD